MNRLGYNTIASQWDEVRTVLSEAERGYLGILLRDLTFFYDSHAPDETRSLLEQASFEVEIAEFLDLPTSGRDKGRFAIVAKVA